MQIKFPKNSNSYPARVSDLAPAPLHHFPSLAHTAYEREQNHQIPVNSYQNLVFKIKFPNFVPKLGNQSLCTKTCLPKFVKKKLVY
jgi:hypothetical protein